MTEAVAPRPNPYFDDTAARAMSDLAGRVKAAEEVAREAAVKVRLQDAEIERLKEDMGDLQGELSKVRESAASAKSLEKLEGNIGKVVLLIISGFIAAIGAVIYQKGGRP